MLEPFSIHNVQHPNPSAVSPIKVITQSEAHGLYTQPTIKNRYPLAMLGISDVVPANLLDRE